mmetsp:Transcript_99421/g.256963  ORF Transcript_99421/g.256963 Transcript_99421/m.256963 type:complete len:372 (-) Transcript_99421:195-1310(-)
MAGWARGERYSKARNGPRDSAPPRAQGGAAAAARAMRRSVSSLCISQRSSSLSAFRVSSSSSSSLSCMCRSQTHAPKRLRNFIACRSSLTCCRRASFSGSSGRPAEHCCCFIFSSSSRASKACFSSAQRSRSVCTSSMMESTDALPFFEAAVAASRSPTSRASTRHMVDEQLGVERSLFASPLASPSWCEHWRLKSFSSSSSASSSWSPCGPVDMMRVTERRLEEAPSPLSLRSAPYMLVSPNSLMLTRRSLPGVVCLAQVSGACLSEFRRLIVCSSSLSSSFVTGCHRLTRRMSVRSSSLTEPPIVRRRCMANFFRAVTELCRSSSVPSADVTSRSWPLPPEARMSRELTPSSSWAKVASRVRISSMIRL